MSNESEHPEHPISAQVITYDDDDDPSSPRKRKRKAILKKMNEFRDKVWWNRHQNRLIKLESGAKTMTDEERPHLMNGVKAAQEIEAKYGIDNLGWDDFEWGMLNGKLSALRWVMGERWDDLET